MMEPAISESLPGDVLKSDDLFKQSYAAAVSKRPSLKKHDFEVSVVDGVSTIEVPNSVISESVPLWEDFLVGRFPSTAPHVAKIHVIVNKIWTLGDKNIRIVAYEINSASVKFRIRDASTRMRILRRGMWNIAGLPMIVSKWSPILEETQPEIKTLPMWVILKNVPHSLYSWAGLGFLSSLVGTPIRLHTETELCSNFEEAKVFVEVNLTQEIPKSFQFKLEQDIHTTVEFVYPWLPPRCVCCKKWGHLVETCLAKKVVTDVVVTQKITDEIEEGEVIPEHIVSTSVIQSALVETPSPIIRLTQEQTLHLTESTPISTTTTAVSEVNLEQGWLTVSPGKGSRSGPKQQDPLFSEQVTILAASRFSVLSDKEDDEGDQRPDLENDAVSAMEEVNSNNKGELEANNMGLQPAENHKKSEPINEKRGPSRASIPRSSKQMPMINQESFTLKAEDTHPSTSSRRNSRKRH